jgi:6-phosphogluconolactonase (cycloisomerase 2 family)
VRSTLCRHIEGVGAGDRRVGRHGVARLVALATSSAFAVAVAVLCVVGVLVVFASSARAAGTLYVSSDESEAVSAYSIAANGSLSAVPGSPFNAAVPLGFAITPDGRHLYVADYTLSGGVSAFSIASSGSLTPLGGSPFPAEPGASHLAITPDGRYLFAASQGGDVSAYSIASDGSLTVVPGSPFPAGSEPSELAITPDGRTLFVTNEGSNDLSAFSIASDGTLSTIGGSPYPAGESPHAISLTPDGKYLYVASLSARVITAFSIAPDGALATLAGSPFPSAYYQLGESVTPDGKYLYTSSVGAGEYVSTFSIAANGGLTAVPEPRYTSGGDHPGGITVTPDSRYIYSANHGEYEGRQGPEEGKSSISALSIAPGGSLSAIAGSPFFETPYGPVELAVTPDEGPEAAFTSTSAPASDPSTFNAAASSDSDYPLASYKWEFGDGQTETTSSATTTHTYTAASTYTATLTVTDAAGCSTGQIFTGQAVSCNGSSQAQISLQVTVPPGVGLGVARIGSGSGTVTTEPSGIVCGAACSYAFGEGEKVKLMESPEPGSAFAGWSGACSGREETCEVTMSEASEVKAAFIALPTFPLTVERTGTGAGVVTSEPSGIECEAACSHAFWKGEKVKLNENPQAGSTFAGWSGGGCSGSETTCEVTISADTNVTAGFSRISSPPPPNETRLSSTPQQLLPLPVSSETAPAPSVKDARQSARRWREDNQLAHISHDRTPTGTAFSFSLNEQANVSFSFAQLPAARQSAHSCLTKTRENVKRSSCNNSTVPRGTLSFTGHSGTNKVLFAGRISRTDKLKPGRYELTITATNATGQRSKPVSLSFTITQ